MAFVAAIPAIYGAIAAAVGAAATAVSSAQSANYQGKVASNNATIERQNAQYSAGAGAVQTEKAGLEGRDVSGRVKAGFAANGLETSTGSPSDVGSSQRELNQFNSATVANNAALSVYGYNTQATGYQAEAGLDQAQVGSDLAGGALRAAGGLIGSSGETGLGTPDSLLSGAPSVPNDYQWMQDSSLTDYQS